jgi:hypothetical protein
MLTVKEKSSTIFSVAEQIDFADRDLMKFSLHYTGPLASSSKTPHHRNKMAIRRALHPQLANLWKISPVLKHVFVSPDSVFEVGEFAFLPLVTRRLNLVCSVEVLMWRQQEPGGIIKNTGDIDNQLSTLFDALRMPHVEQELAGEQPAPSERPHFLCLLEDDYLIVRESVDNTDRLLEPLASPSDVRLVIQVTVRATKLTGENRLFAGYDIS